MLFLAHPNFFGAGIVCLVWLVGSVCTCVLCAAKEAGWEDSVVGRHSDCPSCKLSVCCGACFMVLYLVPSMIVCF